MTVKRTSLGIPQSVAPVRAEPIGLSELRFVRDALAEFAPDWATELDGICSDEATLVIVPENGDDEVGPSFVVSRENYGYRLDQVHWDAIHDLGLFASLADIMAAVRRLLTDVMQRPAARPTLH